MEHTEAAILARLRAGARAFEQRRERAERNRRWAKRLLLIALAASSALMVTPRSHAGRRGGVEGGGWRVRA